MEKQGKLIVFEGPDKCGKTHLMNEVVKKFKEKHPDKTIEVLKFPNYTGKGIEFSTQSNERGVMSNGEIFGGFIIDDIMHEREAYDLITKKRHIFDIKKSLEDFISFQEAMFKEKADTLPYIQHLMKTCDYIFIDRFILSQVLYAKVLNSIYFKDHIGIAQSIKIRTDLLYKTILDSIYTIGFLQDNATQFMRLIKLLNSGNTSIRDNNILDDTTDYIQKRIDIAFKETFIEWRETKSDKLYIVDQNRAIINSMLNCSFRQSKLNFIITEVTEQLINLIILYIEKLH